MNQIEDFQGQPAVRLQTASGDRATVLLHGAQVVSWRPAGGGERLYLSGRSAYGEGNAIRGGVPIVFPQFNRRGPDFSLPKHGIVRTRRWTLDEDEADGSVTAPLGAAAPASSVRLHLADDAATRSQWPHAFSLTMTVSLGARKLDLALGVRNCGAEPFAFTAALHTYLEVADISGVRVNGLQGVRYLDTVDNTGSVGAEPDLAFDRETDRIYHDVPAPLTVLMPDGQLEVAMEGFRDVVVWNPWADLCASLPDMSDDGYRRMLCVEAAAIDKPVRLDAGGSWLGRQTLTAL